MSFFILNSHDFDRKIIFKLLEGRNPRQKISFFIDRENPMKPVINHSPEEVKSALHTHRAKQFGNVTQTKNLAPFLSYTPKLSTLPPPPSFSPEIIIEFLCSRSNTSPGPDTIQYNFFKYMRSHNSKIFDLLSTIYTACYNFAHIPDSWKHSTTISIPKEECSQSFANWRPIALLNTLYKGFSLIINQYLQQILLQNNIIPDEQCGFLPGRDAGQAINTYLEIIKISNQLKTPLHAIYIDLVAAFDSVQHWTLEQIMNHINLHNHSSTTSEP